MKYIIKLSPTIIFVIGFIVIQFIPTSYAFIIFGLLLVGYIYGIPVFLERYRKSNELNEAISFNYLFLSLMTFLIMSAFTIKIILEVF